MAGVYLACLVFIFLGLGPMAMAAGFSIIKFLKYIGEEILIVLGTSSSESVLPRIMAKLEYLGLLRSRWSAWSCRPGIPSTWTAPRST